MASVGKTPRTPHPHLEQLTQVLALVDRDEITRAVRLLRKAQRARKMVWIVGNGGSAATASHFANDLLKMCGIRAVAVPDQTPAVTAFGNDVAWHRMFSEYLRECAQAGDVLVAISCSGRSDNVIAAVSQVWSNVIVLTGWPGEENDLDNLAIAQVAIYARANDIKVQEDVHMAVCHAIAGELSQ